MPELPEVETVRNVLKKKIINKKIAKIDIYYDKIIKEISVAEFKDKMIDETIIDIGRIGKYLIIKGKINSIIIHLRMEGKLFYYEKEKELTKHDHIVFTFTDKTTLIYNDTRKFGTMNISKTENILENKGIAKQGIEANSDDLNLKYLKQKIKGKKQAIKQTLLDQTIISGLGNIYVDEVLFASKVSPFLPTNQITDNQLKAIIKNCKIIIDKAILNKGTTIKSFAVSEEDEGEFQGQLQIYGRKGKKCKRCNTIIEKGKIGGRGTHYCPQCQGEK